MRTRPLDRRRFLTGAAGALSAAVFTPLRLDLLAEQASAPVTDDWDAGRVRHLLPQVSDTRLLLKASFDGPLTSAPTLTVGTTRVPGRMNDTAGEFWQFHATGLQPGRAYELSLTRADGTSLCAPWPVRTFPAPHEQPESFRVLFFTCAGGPGGRYDGIGDRSGFLPTAIRHRLLRRALTFAPDAAVANGDHIYWDLHQWLGDEVGALSASGARSAFDFSDSVFATSNETAMKAAAGPQIVPVYGTQFRSTPMFFLQDDHDHWENDAASDEIVNFPIPWFQLQLARATQQLYYPEFLPDTRRPAGLPWSGATGRGDLSESFGTIRYGRLAEVLLYDVRRTVTLAGPTAVFVDGQVERWLLDRTASDEVRHLVHAPSNPFGWSAGKWGEWYPDILDPARTELTTAIDKPYWQEGWLRQHDRLAEAIVAARHHIPIVISGDLHAIGVGRVHRAGALDFNARPLTTVLSGPVGTSVRGFPSVVRGIGATPPEHSGSGRVRGAHRGPRLHHRRLPAGPDPAATVPLGRRHASRSPPSTSLEPFYSTELPV